MVLLGAFWLFLSATFFCVGYPVLRYIDPDTRIDRAEDRFFLALWLGLILVGVCLETLALFVPLAGVGFVFFPLAAFIAARSATIRHELIDFAKKLPGVVPLLIVVVGLYASQPVFWFDTGLYHAQLIRWLSERGIVIGLGQWHSRFAFLSSWFTFPAAFDISFLKGRMTTLMGGWTLFIALLQGLLTLRVCLTHHFRRQDKFVLLALMLAVPIVLAYGVVISPSPDLPIIYMPILIVWAMLVVEDIEVRLLPFILALGAVAIKLSAMPLLLATGLYYLCKSATFFGHRLVRSGLVFAGVLAPHMVGVFLASGCFVYPVALTCIDVSWGLGKEVAYHEANSITQWARWNGPPQVQASFLDWLVTWLGFGPENFLFAILAFFSLFFTFLVRRTRSSILTKTVALAWFGIAFTVWTAPVLRFGLGYLVLVPALVVGVSLPVLSKWQSKPNWCAALGLHNALILLVAILPVFFMVIHFNPFQRAYYEALDAGLGPNGEERRLNPLMPPRLLGVSFDRSSSHKYMVTGLRKSTITEMQHDNLTYFQPDGLDDGLCWNSPLPCSPLGIQGNKGLSNALILFRSGI